MKLNKVKLYELGFDFESMEDCMSYMESLIDYLECHNKNYTKEQYYKILILRDIFKSIDYREITLL